MNAILPPAPPSPPRRPRVALIFGGRSGEHSVSCAPAAGVLREIDRTRYDVLPIGITRHGTWVTAPDDPALFEGGLAEVSPAGGAVLLPLDGEGRLLEARPGEEPHELGRVDVVFPLLHGPFGEDGTIQGIFEMAGIRYVGSGVLASAVGMDKHHMKVALAGAGLPVGPYVVATDRAWRRDPDAIVAAVGRLHFPVFVKPARAGSSLGISRVERLEDVAAAVESAREHDPKVVIEEGLDGREIECGVLEGRAGGAPRTAIPGEVVMHSDTADFYDFETKYFDTEGFHMECPADIPAAHAETIRALAARAFEALDCEGLARVDFFLTPDGHAVVNEVNTMPGFTPFSMFPVMWEQAGFSYRDLVGELIELALERPLGLR